MRKFIQIGGWTAVIAVLAALPCLASDSAVLRNGFSIRHERRQVIGTITRLYTTADSLSFVDIPTAEIDHFEAAPIETVTPQPGKDEAASQLQMQFPPRNVERTFNLNEVVNAASGTYHLDPDLVNSVIRAESGFNVRAVSPKGAQGLMQLMPQTASQLGVQNVFNPQSNVEGGTRYLRELLERYDFDLIKALAAYNAGPHRVEQYGGVPPYYETKAYVARIVRDYNKKLAAKNATQPVAKTSSASKSAATHRRATKQHKSVPQTQAKANPTHALE
ncbi:MAG TPA: lytic transglycosylase domain-containing protein [Candidatus Acidoferrum sp.]|nr:lytic transglycosylase domain-containing protein [Candidatus Acidoferrum sp.]